MEFEAGKFYRTRNGSKVKFKWVDGDGDCVFSVIQGGHGDSVLWGERSGDDYFTLSNGVFGVSSALPKEKRRHARGMDVVGPWTEEQEKKGVE